MKKEYIDISFFKKAILPKDPKHKISFDDANDIYNPFSKHNFIFNLKIAKSKCALFIESIYKILISNELNESINGSSLKKMSSQADICMHEHMSTILSSIISKKSKALIKQIQSPWAHMLISFMLDDLM